MVFLRSVVCVLGMIFGSALAANKPASAYLPGIVHWPQTYNNCGPASVAGVLGYYGVKISQAEVQKVLRPTGEGYMSAEGIDGYVKTFGLRATRFKAGEIGHLKRLLDKGIPVLVLQWLDRPGHIPHFRIVRGYDDANRVVWVSDPYFGGEAYISYADFMTLWDVYNREFIPIYPKDWTSKIEAILNVKIPKS